MATLNLFQHVVRNGLQVFRPVLDGQPVDGAELDLTGGHFVCKKLFEDSPGFLRDGRAYAVAAKRADDDGFYPAEVEPVALGFDSFHSLKLRNQKFPEVLLGSLDRSGIDHSLFLSFMRPIAWPVTEDPRRD